MREYIQLWPRGLHFMMRTKQDQRYRRIPALFKVQRSCPIYTDTLNNSPRGIHMDLINLCSF